MDRLVVQSNRLAYEDRGSGYPIVFVHGMTFSRGTWLPVVDRLVDRFRCITIDLPGHGETPGLPDSMEEVAAEVHQLIADLGIERPVMVGHSAGGLLVTFYAAYFEVAGVVNVDQPLDVAQFARMVRQIEPALRGPNFESAFEPIRQSIGVEMLPEPLRSRTLAAQTVRQGLVLAYWSEVFQQSPEDLQASVDDAVGRIDVPYLAVFGRRLADDERARLRERLPSLELEEMPERGHMVHLMEPEFFAGRVAEFVERCSGTD